MWEEIEYKEFCTSDRLKVPDGWIVRSYYNRESVHQIFVEDKRHTWKLNKKENNYVT